MRAAIRSFAYIDIILQRNARDNRDIYVKLENNEINEKITGNVEYK